MQVRVDPARTACPFVDTFACSEAESVSIQVVKEVAHDFCNLLAAISASAAMIEISTQPGSRERANAECIQYASEQAQELIKALLTLGRTTVVAKTSDLQKVLADIADLFSVSLPNNIDFELDLPERPIIAWIEQNDFVRTIMNIAINARDALNSRTGKITLRLQHVIGEESPGPMLIGAMDNKKDYACVTIEDNGSGIDPEILGRIFSPYFSTKGNQGSGLGLSIVSRMILANDGALNVVSEPGIGSAFHIYWPLELARNAAKAL